MTAITARVAADKTTVAVIITTYNHARFLLEAIHSVLAQTNPATDILVGEDAPSGQPRPLGPAHPPVKRRTQGNAGPPPARHLK